MLLMKLELFIQKRLMKAMSKKQADKIIGDVAVFEENVRKQFLAYINKH